MEQAAGGVTTRCLYDGLGILAELNAAGASIATSYVHGPGVDELLATRNHATGQILYHLHDHLGSTAALTNSAGQVQGSFTYAAFGATRTKTGPADTRFRFTGRELDAESGLYHYRARAYDPAAGRFLQPDPWPANPSDPRILNANFFSRLVSVGHPLPGSVQGFLPTDFPVTVINFQAGLLQNPLGLNIYPYVGNSPLRWTDPLGLEGKRNTPAQNAAIGLGRAAGSQIGQSVGGRLGGIAGAVIGYLAGGAGGAQAGFTIGTGIGTAYGGVVGAGIGAAIGAAISGGSVAG